MKETQQEEAARNINHHGVVIELGLETFEITHVQTQSYIHVNNHYIFQNTNSGCNNCSVYMQKHIFKVGGVGTKANIADNEIAMKDDFNSDTMK